MARETIIHTVLSNCLQVKIKHSDQRTINLGLFIDHGSRDETIEENGLAHYIEHVLFNPNHFSARMKEVYDELLSMGLVYEAFTSKEYTRIVLTCIPEQLEPALAFLSLLVTEPRITIEAVEHERPIILHEHAMRFSSSSALRELLDNAFWGDYSLGLFVIGRKENIQRFSVEDIESRFAARYVPDNTHLVALGPVDPLQLNTLTERYFGAWQNPSTIRHDISIINEPRVLSLPTKHTRIDLLIGYLGVPAGSKELPTIELLADILGGGLTSRLFIELREKRKLAYLVHAYTMSYSLAGYLAIAVNCQMENLQQVFEIIQQEIERLKQEPVTEKELQRAKAIRRTAVLRVLENSEQHLKLLGQRSLRNEDFFVDLTIHGIQAVKPADIQSMANRIFDLDNMAIVGFGPKTQDILSLI